MSVQFRKLPWMLLGQVPTVLTLALIGVIAWWGYSWDWKIPTLPELMDPSLAKSREEGEKKPEDEKDRASIPGKGELPLVKLPSEEAMKAAGIDTKRVEERVIDDFVKAHGHVDYNQNHYAHLSTRASGTAWRVFKQQGDEVRKGEVLALIASPELAQLKFALQQTLLTMKMRERKYQRLEKAGTATVPIDLENAHFDLRDARVALSKTQQSLQNLGLNISLDQLTPLTVTDEQIAARLRTLGIPDSLLQRLDAAAVTGNNLLPIYAPFDGMVVKRDIVIGEMATPATPQFHLADLRHLWICMHVRLEDVGRLKEGQEVVFHLDGPNEDAPPAKITWISAEVDEKTRTVPVRADVANLKGRLRPNAFGDGRILVDRRKRPLVPNEALQFDGTSHLVFVRGQSPTEFQPHRVQIGPPQGKFTVILSGVEAGQTIATSGSHVLLSELQKERITDDD